MRQQWAALSTSKKIAIGAAVAVCAPIFIAGAVSGAKDSLGNHSATTTATANNAAAEPRPAQSSAAASAKPSTPAPAQMLADLDGDTRPASDYQHALDALAPKCTQDEYHIAALAHGTLEDLQKNGVTDETELSVLQHLNGSVPAGAPRMDCQSVAAAYAVLRESQ